MPTDPTVQTVPPANGTPPASSTQPALTDDQIKQIPYDLLKKAHPDVQNIETRYAAAHKEIDGKKTKRELEAENARLRVLAGESTDVPAATTTTSAPQALDAAKIQSDIEWNIANKTLIQAAGQLYADNLAKGMDRQDALDLALARRPSGDKTIAEQMRAQVTASAGGGSDRLTNTGPDTPGVSKQYIEDLRKKYPNLPEQRLVEMVNKSIAMKQQLG